MHNRLYAYTSKSTHTKTHRDKPYARAHTHTRVGSDNNKMQRSNPLCLLMQCAQKLIFGHWGFGKDVPWESSLATSLRPRCLRTCMRACAGKQNLLSRSTARAQAKDAKALLSCCLTFLRTRRVGALIYILGDVVVTRQHIKLLHLDGSRVLLACCA